MAPGRGPTSFVGYQPKALSDMAPTLDWMVGDPAKYVALAVTCPLVLHIGIRLGGSYAEALVDISRIEMEADSTRARAVVGEIVTRAISSPGTPPAGSWPTDLATALMPVRTAR